MGDNKISFRLERAVNSDNQKLNLISDTKRSANSKSIIVDPKQASTIFGHLPEQSNTDYLKAPEPITVEDRPSFLDSSMNHPLNTNAEPTTAIPAPESPKAVPGPALSIQSTPKTPNRRILIIDDEPFNLIALDVTIKCLKISGLDSIVDTAHSGSIALEKIEMGIQSKNAKE